MAAMKPGDAVSNAKWEQSPPEQGSVFTEETVADHILGDQPAQREEDDRLGFTPYVTAAAQFLTHESTKVPLTMSIEGLWGTGKSSFMRLLQRKLEALGKRRFVTFEAWRYSADEGLWAAFLDTFDSQLRSGMSRRERAAARWRLVKLRMSLQGSMDTAITVGWMAAALLISVSVISYTVKHGFAFLGPDKDIVELMKATGAYAGAAAALLVFLSKLGELMKSPAALDRTRKLWSKPDFHDRMPLIHDMTTNLSSLVEAYVKNDTVYVFIDDLDRCEHSKAADLIQGLFSLASSAPKVALIIGLDREKVAAALAAKLEKLLPYLYNIEPGQIYAVGNEYGQRFLEKFIQVPYVVPAARPSGLKAMINPNVPPPDLSPPPGAVSVQAVKVATGENDSTTLNAMIDMANEVFDHNPRNIKQFVNSFRLQAFIASQTGLFENPAVMRMTGMLLTVPQLGKYVALCMRWPNFVEAATLDDKLYVNMETAASLAGAVSMVEVTEPMKEWLRDRHLVALLKFCAFEAQFTLANVDFQLLSTVAPGRIVQAGPAPGTSKSYPEFVQSRSGPTMA